MPKDRRRQLNETLQGDAKGRHFNKRSDLVWLAVLSVVVCCRCGMS